MEKLPKSPIDLYIEMYCEVKKNKTPGIPDRKLKNRALKSWARLSKEEKERFHKKFNECHMNYKKTFADYLESSAELYMKEQKSKETQNERTGVSQDQESHSDTDVDRNSLLDVRSEHTYILDKDQDPTITDMGPPNCVPVPEPAPPTALNARRLYELTCRENPNWYGLSKTEKRKYQNAVSTLKRQYINEYKAYLEQLPDRDLFEHYVKTLY